MGAYGAEADMLKWGDAVSTTDVDVTTDADGHSTVSPSKEGSQQNNNTNSQKKSGLYIGGEKSMALGDLNSLLPACIQGRVTADDNGLVSFDKSGLSQEEINDPGVQLLTNLTSSGSSFLYSVSDQIRVSNVSVVYNTGEYQSSEVQDVNVQARPEHVVNASSTPFGPTPSNGTVGPGGATRPGMIFRSYYAPSFDNKYSGVVAISPGAQWTETTAKIEKSRASAVFHELSENYYRVNGAGYTAAHNSAIADQMRFSTNDIRRSKLPGHVN